MALQEMMKDHPCSEVIGSVPRFLIVLTEKLANRGIDIKNREIDHVCYRCGTTTEYLRVCRELSAFGVVLLESMIGGRPISTISLHEPIEYSSWKVQCIEVTCPKPGRSHSIGLEHAEVVIGSPADGVYNSRQILTQFEASYPDVKFDKKAIDKEINADISLSLLSGMTVKFHSRPLKEVIEEELKGGHFDKVPPDYFAAQDCCTDLNICAAPPKLTTSLVGSAIRMEFPPPEESDSDIAKLLSDPHAMRHLKAMAKLSRGGWHELDAAKRRSRQATEHASSQSLNGIVYVSQSDSRFTSSSELFAGIAGFRSIDWWSRSAEMGIILAPRWWRQGICLDVHIVCLSYAFEDICLNRVEFKTASNNQPMLDFCKHVLGATEEGRLRDAFPSIYMEGNFKLYEDVVVLSILAHEWPEVKKKLIKRREKGE